LQHCLTEAGNIPNIQTTTLTPDHSSVLTLRYGENSFQDDCDPMSAGFDAGTLGFDSSYASNVPVKQFPPQGI
jgi:hypothetical protein